MFEAAWVERRIVMVVAADDQDVRRLVDGHGDTGGGGAAIAVGDGVGEAVGAVEVGVRGIGEGAVAVVHHGAVGPLREAGDGQAVAVEVAVVGEQAGGADDQGRVLVGRRAVVRRHGGVVDRVDGHGDAGGGGAAIAVGDGVGEAVGAVEVGVRGIGEGAVAVVHHGAVGALGDRGHDQRIAVGIAVVGQDCDRDRSVLVGAGAVVRGSGRIVDVGEVDGDGIRHAAAGLGPTGTARAEA